MISMSLKSDAFIKGNFLGTKNQPRSFEESFGHTEIPDRKNYIPDPIFQALKDPPQKDIDWLNKYFPIPTGKKVATRKGAFKPKQWSIKNPHIVSPKIVEEFLDES